MTGVQTCALPICAVFARFPEIEKAILYGSRAKGNFKTGSDIDLTLCGEALTSDLRPTIASELDDLLLPYVIDLSIFDELNHAKLREHIKRVGVVFYERANQEAGMKKNWEVKNFEDCLEKVVYSKKIQRKDFLETGEFPIISQEQEFINGYWNDSEDLFKVNKPVVIFGDHTQVLKYVEFDFVLGADGVKILQPIDDLNPKYFYYFMINVEFKKLGYARHYRLLKEISIPIPPFPEQKRIVGILDKAFSAISTAKANAEKNLQNARELFESYLQVVFANPGDGWETEKMVEVCSIITCGVASTPKYVDASVGIPFLSAQNVKNGEVILVKYKFISREFHEKLTKNNKPTKGGILYSRVGAKYGEAGVVEHDFDFSVYVSLTLIRPIFEKLNNYFLKYYLNSPVIKSLAKKSIQSSGVPNLNVKEVREFPVTYPSLEKQHQIVNQIETLLVEIKKLENIYQQKIKDLNEMKKSILQKAFNGELAGACA